MSSSLIGNVPDWPVQLVVTCLLGCLGKRLQVVELEEELEEDTVAILAASEGGDCNRHFRKQG